MGFLCLGWLVFLAGKATRPKIREKKG